MKKIKFLILLLLTITASCFGQVNTLTINELTINNNNLISKDKSILTQTFGVPSSIEQVYFEMQEKMAYKYDYDGIIFYILDDIIESFEISGTNFSFTNHNIRIGLNISIIESIYPLSYGKRGANFVSLNIEGYDNFISIGFDENNQLIKNIHMGSY